MLPKAFLAFVGLFLQCQAYPSDISIHAPKELGGNDGQIPEWTAMGDSYASGVGAGKQEPGERNICFRFTDAYPSLVQAGIQPVPLNFNNVACSGNTFKQIRQKELLRKPKWDWRYGERPAWGTAPEFVTITMGGNDIGILDLISTCVASFKLFGKDCEAVIKSGHDTINSQKFKDELNGIIKAIVDKGRSTSVGKRFKVFVVGYAQFFNQETTQCNEVSFKPHWNPLPAQKLTIERRTKMNELALALNAALSDAVNGFQDQGVYWIDYDEDFDGHRFCEREEPAPDDPETYFFNWGTKKDPDSEIARKVFERMAANQTSANGDFETDQDLINALSEAVGDDPELGWFLPDHVRMFHPSTRGHEKIREVVLKALNDHGVLKGTSPGQPLAPQPPNCNEVSQFRRRLRAGQAGSASEQRCGQNTTVETQQQADTAA